MYQNKKKRKRGQTSTPRSDFFVLLCQQQLKAHCIAEYRFHPTRKWRFDYAFPEQKVAVEIDGGVWIMGRHNRPRGYLRDLEKFNAAAQLGWRVLKFTPQEKFKLKTLQEIGEALRQRTTTQTLQQTAEPPAPRPWKR